MTAATLLINDGDWIEYFDEFGNLLSVIVVTDDYFTWCDGCIEVAETQPYRKPSGAGWNNSPTVLVDHRHIDIWWQWTRTKNGQH